MKSVQSFAFVSFGLRTSSLARWLEQPLGALCAAPVHQFKQYYRVGNVDDCLSYWNDLYDCLRQRTKYRDAVCEMWCPVACLPSIA